MPDDKQYAADEAAIREMQRIYMNLPEGPKKERLREEAEKAKKKGAGKKKGWLR